MNPLSKNTNAFVKNDKSICQIQRMDCANSANDVSKIANRIAENSESIPIIETVLEKQI